MQRRECVLPLIVGIVGWLNALTCPHVLADEPLIRVDQGHVWAHFDGTPGRDAITAIKRATEATIVLPAPPAHERVTVSADGVPLEQFLRRVLESFDIGGFALVYNADGGLDEVRVAAKGHTAAVSAPSPPAATPLGAVARASMKLGSPGQVIVVRHSPLLEPRSATDTRASIPCRPC
jgi:hypothetical protein